MPLTAYRYYNSITAEIPTYTYTVSATNTISWDTATTTLDSHYYWAGPAVTTSGYWTAGTGGLWQAERAAPRAATPEEIARVAEHTAERQRIEVVAQELLHTLLDEQQAKQWAERKRVVVKGKKRRYEVGDDNRIYVRDGSSVRAYCCHAPWAYPVGDRVAAAILELETDEDAVIAKGNLLQLSPTEIMVIGGRLAAA